MHDTAHATERQQSFLKFCFLNIVPQYNITTGKQHDKFLLLLPQFEFRKFIADEYF
jgi:hypothetical protein